MAFGIDAGTGLNSTPSAKQVTLAGNYLDLASTDGQGWAQQFVPDLMEQEAEVFGNRTVSGFLEMVGAEEPMTADQVVWSEQGRLHLSYTGQIKAGSTNIIEILADIDSHSAINTHGVREGDMILITDAAASVKAYVSNVAADEITVACYQLVNLTDHASLAAGDAVSLFVFGSEFRKGQTGRTEGNEPTFKSLSNKPIIMKDMYHISGSDVSQIGWVEVSGEDGQAGYMWYLKAAGDTKSRFAD